jgi:predicted acetyltransferase
MLKFVKDNFIHKDFINKFFIKYPSFDVQYLDKPNDIFIIYHQNKPSGIIILKKFNISSGIFQEYSILIALEKHIQGKGLGKKAISQLDIKEKIYWGVLTNNYPSLKLLQKLNGGVYRKSKTKKGLDVYSGYFNHVLKEDKDQLNKIIQNNFTTRIINVYQRRINEVR